MSGRANIVCEILEACERIVHHANPGYRDHVRFVAADWTTDTILRLSNSFNSYFEGVGPDDLAAASHLLAQVGKKYSYDHALPEPSPKAYGYGPEPITYTINYSGEVFGSSEAVADAIVAALKRGVLPKVMR